MKKILLLLAIFSFAFGQTRTSVWALPQWGTGDTLKAGTKNTPALSNYSLNNAFARIDSIASVQIDSNGLFRSLNGRGSGNLDINAGVGTLIPQRIVMDDSLYGYYNWQTEGNLLVQGNATIGGYMSVDSLLGNVVADTIGARSIYATGNIVAGANLNGEDLFVNDDAVIENELRVGSDVSDGSINIYNITSGSTNHINISASYIFGSTKQVYFENRSGVIALQTENDSLQAPTVHAVLFNSEKVAGTTLNDTSALFSEWTTNSTSNRNIVRLKYVHKAGIKNVVARYQQKVTANDYYSQVTVGSLSNSTTGSDASYADNSVTVDVSGLTANTSYDLVFAHKVITSGTVSTTQLVITAESN